MKKRVNIVGELVPSLVFAITLISIGIVIIDLKIEILPELVLKIIAGGLVATGVLFFIKRVL